MWKDVLNKGKCLVGIHEGEWSFIKEKDCTRIRVCARCATESRKVEHNLGEWAYVNQGNCDQQQTCQRCDEASDREVHEWQEPERRSEESCEQVIVCSRCKAEQEADPIHLWGEWEYISPDVCEQAQTCERCGSSGKKRTEHLWGEWYHSEKHGGAVHVCRRCGHLAVSTQTQILSIISSLTKQQSTAPRQIAAPVANEEAASDDRAEMFGRLKAQMNDAGGAEESPLRAQAEGMNAAMAAQFEKIKAKMNELNDNTAPMSKADAATQAELAEQFEMIKRQMTDLSGQQAALPPVKSGAKKSDRARQVDFERMKAELQKIVEAEKAMAGVFAQVAKSAETATANTPRAAKQVERDSRLVGHWRFTEANFGVTDYHRVMKADGSFADSSHSSSQFGESRTGPEPGRWRTGNKVLYLNYSDGRSLTLQYHLENGTLFFPEARVQRLWERVQ